MKRNKKIKASSERSKKLFGFSGFNLALPEETKKWIVGLTIFIIAAIISLSFFDLAGVAGQFLMKGLNFLIGRTVFLVPLILVLTGLISLKTKYQKYLGPVLLAIFILTVGLSGILESLDFPSYQGGKVGFLFNWPLQKLFGSLVTKIIFSAIILFGLLIFWYLLKKPADLMPKQEIRPEPEEKKSLFNRFLKQVVASPKFKIKTVEPILKEPEIKAEETNLELKTKEVPANKNLFPQYQLPPVDLLEGDKGKPLAGDTITNSAIIKKTLENFGLGVEMSEINIGPTVTQYALKPAEGIKLSKITALANNLSLALASHPIRIEAPIPGKSLVGIEVPNKSRCLVRLRDAISNPYFQKNGSGLSFVLGKDVSGNLCYADLARMPHLLVAGATGTGKTIFLNNLILSFLYQNSPETLRFILIDPKRVEFSAYHELPHLLCPVIFDAQRAINGFKWLVSEMENRFNVLSNNGSRDITSFNQKALKEGEESLPYIVLIVDELADLMAAKGREVEAGIVRLAQMARAVGIHLVLATQRPSVEVITGLIKANITSRITFQVASQVDSRTVIDMSGAEKLLGKGDLLFLSAEITKPKRIQGAYVAEKEVRRVVEWIKEKNSQVETKEMGSAIFENHLAKELEMSLEAPVAEFADFSETDPLYEEAKRVVIEAKKASASLLQRRLRIGYARAARLLDILEENKIIGPGEGAKPRQVYFSSESEIEQKEADSQSPEKEDNNWQQV